MLDLRPAATAPDLFKPVASAITPPPGVLLVEDDDLIRMLAVEGLGEYGWTIAEAPTGGHALELLARDGQGFCAAILDMGLPDMTGADLVHAIVTRHPEMAIVVASGYGASDFEMGLPPGGRWRLVQKPYLPEQLNGALRELGISPGPLVKPSPGCR
jgi:DNA-binding NtrC family response regulator